MIRQYCIFYRRDTQAEFAQLQPGAHKVIYEHPAVGMAIETLKVSDAIEAISLRVYEEQFQLFVSRKEVLDVNHFALPEAKVTFEEVETADES